MTWLLLDTNYLCYRAYHAMGHLSFNEIKTGMTFGVLRDVVGLQDRFDTTCVVFCFDYGRGIRQDFDPKYKANRRKTGVTDEDMYLLNEVRSQINNLRRQVLRKIGFRNVFYKAGYEADDIIASLCETLSEDPIVIVSSDSDLFQLLSPRINIWNPHKNKLLSIDGFREQYGIEPTQWVDVKAIAGCPGDNVIGIDGVGEKTAIKYITGKLKPKTKAYEKIVGDKNTWEKNIRLVKLPYRGTPSFETREDEVTVARWRTVCDEMGMQSLRNNPPISKRVVRTSYGKGQE